MSGHSAGCRLTPGTLPGIDFARNCSWVVPFFKDVMPQLGQFYILLAYSWVIVVLATR